MHSGYSSPLSPYPMHSFLPYKDLFIPTSLFSILMCFFMRPNEFNMGHLCNCSLRILLWRLMGSLTVFQLMTIIS